MGKQPKENDRVFLQAKAPLLKKQGVAVYSRQRVLHIWDFEDGFREYKIPYPRDLAGCFFQAIGGMLFYKTKDNTTVFAWNPITGYLRRLALSTGCEYIVVATSTSHRLCKAALTYRLKLQAVSTPPIMEWTDLGYLGDRFSKDTSTTYHNSRMYVYKPCILSRFPHAVESIEMQALDVDKGRHEDMILPRPVQGRSFGLPPSRRNVHYAIFNSDAGLVAISMEDRLHFQGCVRVWLYKPSSQCHVIKCNACKIPLEAKVPGYLQSDKFWKDCCACGNKNWEQLSSLPDHLVYALMSRSNSKRHSWFCTCAGGAVLMAFSANLSINSCEEVTYFKLDSKQWGTLANPFREESRSVKWSSIASLFPSFADLDMDWGWDG